MPFDRSAYYSLELLEAVIYEPANLGHDYVHIAAAFKVVFAVFLKVAPTAVRWSQLRGTQSRIGRILGGA